MRAYKDSGIEWLGEIPEHWDIKRLRYIGYIFGGLTGKTSKDFSNEYIQGFKPYITFKNVCNNTIIDFSNIEYVSINVLEIQNRVIKNDILFLQSSETLDEVGKSAIYLSDKEIYLNTFCKGFRVQKSAYPIFLNYLFVSLTYKRYFMQNCSGFTRINLRQEHFLDIPLIIPPIEEQKAIAEFLDSKCKQIESFVDKKQRLITLLNEKKQALINECVTKGLDKNVNFKDSGIEHLGAIPTHWEIKRLKYIVSLQNQKSGNIDSLVASLPQNDEYLCHSNDSAFSRHSDLERSEREESHKNNNTNFRIGLENIESKTGKYIPTSEIVFEEDGIKFENGDILFGKLRPYLAKVFLADRGGICVSEFLVLRTKGANNHFLKFLMLSPLFIDIVDSSTYGTKMPRANWEFIGNLKIPLPPIEEQKAIAEFLDSEISKIDSIIGKIKKQIELIKEYKSTLINQAVCGRIEL